MKSFLFSILLLSFSTYGWTQESSENTIYQYNSKYDNYSQRNSSSSTQNTQQSINSNPYNNSANTSLNDRNSISDNTTILNNISGNAKNNGQPCYYVKEITDFNKKLHEMNNIENIVPLNNK